MPEHQVAEESITAHCPKCKLNLAHTIVERDGEKTTQVTCNTCEDRHPYKLPAKTPKPRAARVKKGEAPTVPVGARWEARMAVAQGKEHVYARGVAYRIGDIVLHEQFGKGVVLKLATDKCYVLFEDKERPMASGN